MIGIIKSGALCWKEGWSKAVLSFWGKPSPNILSQTWSTRKIKPAITWRHTPITSPFGISKVTNKTKNDINNSDEIIARLSTFVLLVSEEELEKRFWANDLQLGQWVGLLNSSMGRIGPSKRDLHLGNNIHILAYFGPPWSLVVTSAHRLKILIYLSTLILTRRTFKIDNQFLLRCCLITIIISHFDTSKVDK